MTNLSPYAPDATIILHSGNTRRAWIEFECPTYVVAVINGAEVALNRSMIVRIDRDAR